MDSTSRQRGADPVNIIIVDPCSHFKRILSEIIDALPGFKLSGTATDFSVALSKLERMPVDIIVIDTEAEQFSGESVLDILRRDYPGVIPIMVSSNHGLATPNWMGYIESGALDFIYKPKKPGASKYREVLQAEFEPVLEHCRDSIEARRLNGGNQRISRRGLQQRKKESRARTPVADHRQSSRRHPRAAPDSATAAVQTRPFLTIEGQDDRDRGFDTDIKVLVYDSSTLFRESAAQIVTESPGFTLVGSTNELKVVLGKIEADQVDVAIIETTSQVDQGRYLLDTICKEYRNVVPIAVSDLGSCSLAEIHGLIKIGVLDYVGKPSGAPEDEWDAILKRDFIPLLEHCRRCIYQRRQLGEDRPCSRRGLRQLKQDYSSRVGIGNPSSAQVQETVKRIEPAAGQASVTSCAQHNRRVDLVVIGVSTGGPAALRHVIPKLKGHLAVPVLLVIHMPKTFTNRMSDALDKTSQIKVIEAGQGTRLVPGTVTVAPGGAHLVVDKITRRTQSDIFEVSLLDTPHVNGCRPSVDVTLESVARLSSCNTLTVIMTGMGSDGAKGVGLIKKRGGYVITQTEETCVIYGMPYAVDRLGLSDERIHLDRIGNRINELVRNGYPAGNGRNDRR